MTSQLTLASSTGIIPRDYQTAAIEAGVACLKDHFLKISFKERMVETVKLLCARGRNGVLMFTRSVAGAEEISCSFPVV